MIKQRQIELLARSLPGVGASEAMQLERMRGLVGELEAVDVERERVEGELRGVVRRVEGVLGKVRGV